MSSCLIIYDKSNYYIGADTACSIFYNKKPYRYSNDMNKIFFCGDDTYFCSGNLYCVQKTVKWINDTFLDLGKIDISMLSDYLINNYNNPNYNKFDIEIVICRKIPETLIIQLSQYNSFEPVMHDIQKNNVGIISCGYKTKQMFDISKNMLLNRSPIIDIYNEVYNKIADNQVGGYLDLYFNGKKISRNKISEGNIIYSKFGDNPALVISDALVGGYVEGSDIEGGTIKIGKNPETGEYTFIVTSDGRVQINAWGGELSDKINEVTDKLDAYSVSIESSSVPMFDENVRSTILVCYLLQNNQKVAAPSGTTYTWVRASNDETSDTVWNNDVMHKNNTSNVIVIDADDVENSAQFTCEVYIP